MDKVLVEVFVPAASRSYDVFIPQTSPMHEVTSLVAKAMEELSSGKFKADSDVVLCDAVSGNIFNINLSVYELGIKNGTKLIMI